MTYEVIFFDLDDTLYPSTSGLWDAIGDRITLYMTERLLIPPEEVVHRRDHYFHSFGTTLNGLRREYHVNPQDYMDFVHQLPLEQYLQADPALESMLSALPQRKHILTNSDTAHTLRVLDRLGVRQHFLTIIDIYALGFVNKPEPEAYRIALRLAGDPPSEACVLVEDSLRNIQPAHELGMTTVYVGRQPPNGNVDVALGRVTEMCKAMPALDCLGARVE